MGEQMGLSSQHSTHKRGKRRTKEQTKKKMSLMIQKRTKGLDLFNILRAHW